MRYFLINGLKPPLRNGVNWIIGPETIKEKKDAYLNWNGKLPVIGNFKIFSFPSYGSISAFYLDIDDGFYYIKTRSQKRAYAIANILLSVFVIYFQRILIDTDDWLLVELINLPDIDAGNMELESLIKPLTEFDSKPMLTVNTNKYLPFENEMLDVCQIAKALLETSEHIQRAVVHLLHSHFLFPNTMSGSYYDAHYRYDRRREPKNLRQKKTYESQILYDLSFLAAFRAIEAILNSNNVREKRVADLVRKLDREYSTDIENKKWECFHLIFSGHKKYITYIDLLKDFLVIRNAVAAHAPLNRAYNLTEDHVYEIQKIAADMIYQTLGIS